MPNQISPAILKSAATHTVRYRGLNECDLRSWPLTRKSDYREHTEQFLALNIEPGLRKRVLRKLEVENCTSVNSTYEREIACEGCIIERSSGTTGPAVWLPKTRAERCTLAINILATRRRIDPQFSSQRFRNLNPSFTVREGTDRSVGAAGDRITEIYQNAFDDGVRDLYIHGGLLAFHATQISAKRITFKFERIETAGQSLSESEQANISSVFGCKIRNQYGTSEVSAIGYSIYPEMVLDTLDSVYVEVIDNSGRIIEGSGEIGNVVVTSNVLCFFPIIRFITGDLGSWEDREGRRCLLLQRDRENALIKYPDGSTHSGPRAMRRIFERIRDPGGFYFKGDWKVRRESNKAFVYLVPTEFPAAKLIRKELIDCLSPVGVEEVIFKTWSGWEPFDKRLAYIDLGSNSSTPPSIKRTT